MRRSWVLVSLILTVASPSLRLVGQQPGEPPLADPTQVPAPLSNNVTSGATVLPATPSDSTLVPSTDSDGKVIYASVPAGPAPAGRPPTPRAGVPVPAVSEPPTPVVHLHVRVPREVAVNQDIEYRLIVENRSTADAHHVTVRDLIPTKSTTLVVEKTKPAPLDALRAGDKVGWDLGTLKRGESREIILVLRPVEGAKGAIENRAWVQFEHGQVVSTALTPGKLTVRQTGPKEVPLNETASFRLEVANNGSVDAHNVEVVDDLPRGLAYVEDPAARTPAPAEWVDEGNGKRRWKVGTLKAGQRRCLDFKARGTTKGQQDTSAKLTAAGGVSQETFWTVAVTAAEWKCEVTGPQDAYCGRPTPYRFTAQNTGTATLDNVVVTAQLPTGSKVVNMTRDGQALQGNVVQWVVGKLEPNNARALEVRIVGSVSGAQTITGTFGSDLLKSVTANCSTKFIDTPGVDFQVRGDTPSAPEVNSQWQYTVRLTNTGTAELTSARVQVNGLEQLRYLGDSQNPPPAPGTMPTPLTLKKPLAPGETAEWTVKVQARAAGDARLVFLLYRSEKDGDPIKHEEGLLIAGVEMTPTGSATPPAGTSGVGPSPAVR